MHACMHVCMYVHVCLHVWGAAFFITFLSHIAPRFGNKGQCYQRQVRAMNQRDARELSRTCAESIIHMCRLCLIEYIRESVERV